MDAWQRVEGAVERAVRHFKAVDRIASDDDYTGVMAIRHALQCGDREMRDAISRIEDIHPERKAFSLLSDDIRRAYHRLNTLRHAKIFEPSDIDPVVLQDGVAAAKTLAELLPEDVARIRKEMDDA
jgi:hypothetical protein